jgi:hypothetical protein
MNQHYPQEKAGETLLSCGYFFFEIITFNGLKNIIDSFTEMAVNRFCS